MMVVKNFWVVMIWYKKQCRAVILWYEKYLSKQVVSITYRLGKKVFAAATL